MSNLRYRMTAPMRAALRSAALEPLASGVDRRHHRPFWSGLSPLDGRPQDHADRSVRALARYGFLELDTAGHMARLTPAGRGAVKWLAARAAEAKARAEWAAHEARRMAALADWYHRNNGAAR